MPALVGIKRTDAHQSVHTAFRLQVTVSIRTLHEQGNALDPRLIAGLIIQDRHTIIMRFGITTIHPVQHIGPVA